jgi:hypothetical protein
MRDCSRTKPNQLTTARRACSTRVLDFLKPFARSFPSIQPQCQGRDQQRHGQGQGWNGQAGERAQNERNRRGTHDATHLAAAGADAGARGAQLGGIQFGAVGRKHGDHAAQPDQQQYGEQAEQRRAVTRFEHGKGPQHYRGADGEQDHRFFAAPKTI